MYNHEYHADAVGKEGLEDDGVGGGEQSGKGGDAEGAGHPQIDLLHVDGDTGAGIALDLFAGDVHVLILNLKGYGQYEGPKKGGSPPLGSVSR